MATKLLVSAVASIAVLALLPREARPCSPPPTLLETGELITGIPTRGVLPLIVDPNAIPSGAEVRVIDSAGELVQGATELLGDRIVWRADEPLAPTTIYDFEVSTDYDFRHLSFQTAADDQAIPLAGTLLDSRLTERYVSASVECCDDLALGSCEVCWATSFNREVHLRAELDEQPLERRFRVAAATDGRVSGAIITAPFAVEQALYCTEISLRSVLDESVQETFDLCIDHAELRTAVEPTPQRSLDCPLDHPPLDPEESSGGCSTTPSRPPLFVCLLVLAALAGCGRRRHVGSRN